MLLFSNLFSSVSQFSLLHQYSICMIFLVPFRKLHSDFSSVFWRLNKLCSEYGFYVTFRTSHSLHQSNTLFILIITIYQAHFNFSLQKVSLYIYYFHVTFSKASRVSQVCCDTNKVSINSKMEAKLEIIGRCLERKDNECWTHSIRRARSTSFPLTSKRSIFSFCLHLDHV